MDQTDAPPYFYDGDGDFYFAPPPLAEPTYDHRGLETWGRNGYSLGRDAGWPQTVPSAPLLPPSTSGNFFVQPLDAVPTGLALQYPTPSYPAMQGATGVPTQVIPHWTAEGQSVAQLEGASYGQWSPSATRKTPPWRMPGVWPEPWPVEEPANEEVVIQAYLDALPPHEFQRLLASFEEMGPLLGLDAASFDIPRDAADFLAFENRADTDSGSEGTQGYEPDAFDQGPSTSSELGHDVQGNITSLDQPQPPPPFEEVAIAIQPTRPGPEQPYRERVIQAPGEDQIACPKCKIPVGTTRKAQLAHDKRYHNEWAESLGTKFPCWLCTRLVQAACAEYDRHRKGREKCTQCTRVVELQGKIALLGDWIVRKDPAIVKLNFLYWQFGEEFSMKLRDWWRVEKYHEGQVWQFVQEWEKAEQEREAAGIPRDTPERGGPSWQLELKTGRGPNVGGGDGTAT